MGRYCDFSKLLRWEIRTTKSRGLDVGGEGGDPASSERALPQAVLIDELERI